MSAWKEIYETIKSLFAAALFMVFLFLLYKVGVELFKGGISLEENYKKELVNPQPTYTPRAGAGSLVETSDMDGMELIYIPAGEFLMGSKETDISAPQGLGGLSWGPDENEKPQHPVYLGAFWIDKTEVTNQQYQMCMEAGACSEPGLRGMSFERSKVGKTRYKLYPVVFISWDDASAYCGWAGRRLPTEAEWEKAARGTEGLIYPWGNQEPGQGLLYTTSRNIQPIGSYPAGASPYGVLDMAGNATEWVADWYSDTYFLTSPYRNPAGPNSGDQHVVKGLGVGNIALFAYRTAYRRGYADHPAENDIIGFRCARSDVK
ncbi:MAG: SUMF1/EgtB/PvdO family nonheme iron enzyme [Anaerolineales bacterium]|nr:SUMF1/EgtB/PvdO family nonheme iron enzyme [Anaerolineales bacterium]